MLRLTRSPACTRKRDAVRNPPVTLGVDIGTTGCRACAVADAGEVVAASSVSYEPERPQAGWAEQDAEVWWDAFTDAVSAVLGRKGTGRVLALGLSSQSTALVPVDAHCRPLRKAIIWQDTRCAAQCDEIAGEFGVERVRDVTGWRPCTFLAWPKILWFMAHEPGLFERTRWLLQVNGFITQRLCGRIVLDRANAVGYPMDLRTMQWHEELCRWRDFPADRVPPIVPSAAVVGYVSRGASGRPGIAPGTPVVAGGMDTACAALAMGAAEPGKAFEVSGTSGGIGVISGTPSANVAMGVAPHIFQGLYVNHAPMSAAGGSLAWCKDQLFPDAGQGGDAVRAYDLMEKEAAALQDGPTGLFFLPYLAGERAPVWDSQARGAMLGLTLGTTRAQLIKMVMEGVAYALRQNVEVAESDGTHIEELVSSGGGSQSRLWCQIKADVTGKPFVVQRPERDAAFGAALLAGIGAGAWDHEEVDDALSGEEQLVYSPRPEVTARYAPYQRAYEQIYPLLRELLRARPDR